MFAVTVNFLVKPAHVAEFTAAMKTQAFNSLNREPGCHQFDVCFDANDPCRIFLYELYTDRAAFDAHLQTEHFLNFDKTVRDWTAEKAAENWVSWQPARG
jgi:quinol monooxygenase YgiN